MWVVLSERQDERHFDRNLNEVKERAVCVSG